MKAAKLQKVWKRCLIHHKKSNTASTKTNVPISQTFSERLKLTIQTYWMREKELKMKFGQLQEKILKASLPVSADLSNDFELIILETHQRKTSWDYFGRSRKKYLQSSQNNATYHPINPDTDVPYQTVNLFSSGKCFFYFIFDVRHTFDKISAALSIQFW